MFKLTESADLEKAGHSLGNYFIKQLDELAKTHAHHAALAAHHDAMKAAHAEHAAHMKAHHDGLADEDVHKAHFAKGHTHHTQMAAHHEAISKAHGAHAETLKASLDAMKALASEWGATVKADGTALNIGELAKGQGIEERIKVVSDAMMTKALESLNSDPKVAETIQLIVLQQVEKAIGGQLVPTAVSAINPKPGLTAVPRTGAPVVATSKVPLEFQKLVAVESEDE